MKIIINVKSVEWWFWALTLVCMIIGLAGRIEGFYGVIAISSAQLFYFWGKHSFTAFPTQVRLVYGVFTIIALFDPTRVFYWALLVGTVMVTFFDRCFIARVLVIMPWNKGIRLS